MSPTPRQIDRAGEHDVRIQWSDGHDSVFVARALRLACPCALCVDESSGFLRHHLGGCGSCAFPLDAPLADLCGHHGLDFAEVGEVIAASAEFERQLRIAPKELVALLAGPQRIRLLDARTPEEWIAARIPGALHLTDERVAGIVQSWPRDTPMVFYCHQGKDSPVTADYFIGHGFTDVRVLEGGIDAWSLEVDPSVRRYQLEYPPPPPGIPPTHTQQLGQ